MHRLRFIVLLVALCCVSIASAQSGISVKSFKELTQDLDARVSYPVTDQNGQKCALVKIYTTESNFSFDNGLLGVTKVIHKPELSEWWVYLPVKTMKLKIMHPHLGQLKDSDDGYYYFPAPLKEAACYRMELTTGKVIVTIEEERKKTGYLVINSKPEGAHVYLNEDGVENYVGTTPFYKNLTYGKYNYRIMKSLYHDEVGVAVIDQSRVIQDISLRPAFGSLKVSSNPPGAIVTIHNDSREFMTPCTIEQLASGRHKVNIVAPRYASFSREVEILDGKATELVATLDARFAKVSINTLPEATITINGQVKGKGNFNEELGEGVYDIEVSLANHRSITRQIEVVAKQSQKLTLEPTPIYGSLNVESQPMFANVTINGKSYGDTPMSIDNLLIGDYEVVLSKDGCATVTLRVTITENNLSTIEATLQQGGEMAIRNDASDNSIIDDRAMVDDMLSTTNLTSGLMPRWSSNVTVSQKDVLQKLIDSMVKVEGGTFTMGATSEQGSASWDDEKPAHQVTISDYMIAKTEVTQELWEAIMGSNPSRYESEDFPVEQVSWDDCQKFILKLNGLTGLNFRLPTEAEWEYAARGGNKSKGYEYSGSNDISCVAWYKGNASLKTHAVATMSPNELGLYDISGNVFEWCSDWYDSYNSNSQINPKGPLSGYYRVFRGGGMSSLPGNCRVSFRSYGNPDRSSNYLGLRLALSVE